MISHFPLANTHPSWRPIICDALSKMNLTYLQALSKNSLWLPGPSKILNAFSVSFDQVNYVLLGESPYPRLQSANGYAFWDEAVTELWSPAGLSKSVNRATSLRNLIKMLLVAKGLLQPDATSQTDIAHLDKTSLIKTNTDLFQGLLNKGFLLLNASLVLQASKVQLDTKAWQPFLEYIFSHIATQRPHVTFILLGNLAHNIKPLLPPAARIFCAIHPYNISFIHDPKVLDFFRPLGLLDR